MRGATTATATSAGDSGPVGEGWLASPEGVRPGGEDADKANGAYYTPPAVVAALVRWAVRRDTDSLLDPSCGDGRFLAAHASATGVERDAAAVQAAARQAPRAELHHGSFFAWAAQTRRRFDCAAGNPPFIRYQTFNGKERRQALALCSSFGVRFSALTASWAPFVAATARLLRPGGRMAFVVPAAIGHAPYAAPLLEYLVLNFSYLHLVALRRKLFPALSEDCWLLFADGSGGRAAEIRLTATESFRHCPVPPAHAVCAPVEEWRKTWQRRLRPYLLGAEARHAYQSVAAAADAPLRDAGAVRVRTIAEVRLGYVTGDNRFFHLTPSAAAARSIPSGFLVPTVRSSRVLPDEVLTPETVEGWRNDDQPMLLLRIGKDATLPPPIRDYLATDDGQRASLAYKCRHRKPWYAVPDVRMPDFFLAYMAGPRPHLVRNMARATCTNALLAVTLRHRRWQTLLPRLWRTSFTQLSCELEGHSLGGGVLKLEPREAARVLLPLPKTAEALPEREIKDAVSLLRRWRHCGD